MPSKSPEQAKLMQAAAHNPAFAKKAGVPVSVAKEFNAADKAKGMAKASKKPPQFTLPRAKRGRS